MSGTAPCSGGTPLTIRYHAVGGFSLAIFFFLFYHARGRGVHPVPFFFLGGSRERLPAKNITDSREGGPAGVTGDKGGKEGSGLYGRGISGSTANRSSPDRSLGVSSM